MKRYIIESIVMVFYLSSSALSLRFEMYEVAVVSFGIFLWWLKDLPSPGR